MSSVRGILERASLDSMIACLLDEQGPVNGTIEVSESAIENSYREFILELTHLYPGVNKDDDELFDAVIRFASVLEEIYLKIGFIVGRKLDGDLREGEEKLKNIVTAK